MQIKGVNSKNNPFILSVILTILLSYYPALQLSHLQLNSIHVSIFLLFCMLTTSFCSYSANDLLI